AGITTGIARLPPPGIRRLDVEPPDASGDGRSTQCRGSPRIGVLRRVVAEVVTLAHVIGRGALPLGPVHPISRRRADWGADVDVERDERDRGGSALELAG